MLHFGTNLGKAPALRHCSLVVPVPDTQRAWCEERKGSVRTPMAHRIARAGTKIDKLFDDGWTAFAEKILRKNPVTGSSETKNGRAPRAQPVVLNAVICGGRI